ncbi:TrkH family potassium uptake protein [Rubeoparvulum massiliense]|uniref:TrkH family potassium uptake protein n=1 Tax=Rubeoparvulum massiliense TaxID=1631346 RepID=UPI00065E9ABE|nr:TrkH family potassium uptake protein [Rubeoparvulum massiliense]
MLQIQSHRLSYNPHLWLIAGFAFTILSGAVLLALPIASSTEPIPFIDALFTATSAVCVTGLNTLMIGTEFSFFGQLIILCLIQIGGLGFMTFAVFLTTLFGKKLSWKQRLVMKESTKTSSYEGLGTLALQILWISFLFEGLSTLLLTIHWSPRLGWVDGFYYALFHSVSAFNNAGFSLWNDSLSQFVGDATVNIAITSLIILGGIGFPVIMDLYKKKSWRTLMLHSKIVLVTTTILIIIGWFFLLLNEYENPDTMGSLNTHERFWAAFFQSVTARTAGFNTIPIEALQATSLSLLILLMFIGASSGGTGGGIKTNTFVVLFFAVRSFIKGEEEINLFERRINWRYVVTALAVFAVSIAVIILATSILLWSEQIASEHFLSLLFEVTSAFGTVGLSTGITANLTSIGKLIMILVMFTGRLGPLTLAFAFTQRSTPAKLRFPEENMLIG